MHCHVYKGAKRDDHYLYLACEIGAANVPGVLLSMLGELSLIVDFELNAERKLPQADAQQVIQEINDKGFYLQMPKKDLHSEEDRMFN